MLRRFNERRCRESTHDVANVRADIDAERVLVHVEDRIVGERALVSEIDTAVAAALDPLTFPLRSPNWPHLQLRRWLVLAKGIHSCPAPWNSVAKRQMLITTMLFQFFRFQTTKTQ